ncbi:Cupredoxin [Xylariaceae sp. FL1019]|nr:Cupredoxin [Xylariaceae sp. FL1019]
MKYSAALLAAIAPLTMAKAIHNVYPLQVRKGDDNGRKSNNNNKGNNNGGQNIAAAATEIIIIWANPGAGAATTTINQAVTVTQTVTAGAAATTVGTETIAASATGTVAGAAATHSVIVGGTAGKVFTPDNVQAAVGDMVIFTFQSQNHTVTQSTFASPCVAMAGGMDSGFVPNPNDTVVPAPQVAMQVMTTDPVWLFCAQTGHCGAGMTFSINPTADKSQSAFQAAAIAQNGQGTGSAITGNATSSAGASSAASAVASATSVASGGSATSAASGAVASSTGVLTAGACVCAVTCGTGSFPAVNAQGLSNFGGFAGAIPNSALEVIAI